MNKRYVFFSFVAAALLSACGDSGGGDYAAKLRGDTNAVQPAQQPPAPPQAQVIPTQPPPVVPTQPPPPINPEPAAQPAPMPQPQPVVQSQPQSQPVYAPQPTPYVAPNFAGMPEPFPVPSTGCTHNGQVWVCP